MKNYGNEERLKVLADFLAKVPVNHFDLNSWICRSSITQEELIQHKCGTSACAVGWACTIPEFMEQGLSMHHSGQPTFKGTHSWDAAEGFFGLLYDEAIALFSSESYMPDENGPEHVAQRIRTFLEVPQEALDEADEASQHYRREGY